jgi:hypothetical protein
VFVLEASGNCIHSIRFMAFINLRLRVLEIICRTGRRGQEHAKEDRSSS